MTFTTKSWGGSRSVTFSADTSSVKYNSATASATVNKIHIAAGALKVSGIEYASVTSTYYAESATVTVQYNGSNVGQFSVNRGANTNSEAFDLTITGLEDQNGVVTLNYTTHVSWLEVVEADSAGSANPNPTIGDLVNGKEITFQTTN